MYIVSLQVLLDKVTELTRCIFNMQPPFRGEYENMIKKGIISLQILKDFPRHYAPEIFSEKNVADIFVSLYICSKINGDKYFMPALLSPLSRNELLQIQNPSFPPLVYHFGGSCSPAGLFCALVVCLSVRGYKLLADQDDFPFPNPHSNAVCFSTPFLRIYIAVVDSFSQFEVHYYSRADLKFLQKSLPKIRATFEDALEEVIYNRKYKVDFPPKAFFCRAEECQGKKLHIANIDYDERELVCSLNPCTIWYSQNDEEQAWLGSSPLPPNAPSIPQLCEELQEVIPDWEVFGIQLGIPVSKLTCIQKENHGDCKICLSKVLEYWHRNPKESKPYSWHTVIAVLRTESVAENALAEKLNKKYMLT